jgi:hypothetical protein
VGLALALHIEGQISHNGYLAKALAVLSAFFVYRRTQDLILIALVSCSGGAVPMRLAAVSLLQKWMRHVELHSAFLIPVSAI